MAGKLPERNPTNILPAQFWDVFIDWVVYAQFAAKGSQRVQCDIEHLAHRRQVEQGIRGDFPFLCSTGEAVIKEPCMACNIDCGCETASIILYCDGSNVVRNDSSHPRF